MRLPNLLDHETIDEVIDQSAAWQSLVQLHCNPNTQLFLCSLFAPICLPNLDKPIKPCRSLCEEVQQNCEGRMQQYGFPWPDMLRCDRFENNDMCIKPFPGPSAASSGRQAVCKSCSQASTFENIMDNFCRSSLGKDYRFLTTCFCPTLKSTAAPVSKAADQMLNSRFQHNNYLFQSSGQD